MSESPFKINFTKQKISKLNQLNKVMCDKWNKEGKKVLEKNIRNRNTIAQIQLT